MLNFQSMIISLVLRFCDQGKCILRLGAIHFAVESYLLGIDYFVLWLQSLVVTFSYLALGLPRCKNL